MFIRSLILSIFVFSSFLVFSTSTCPPKTVYNQGMELCLYVEPEGVPYAYAEQFCNEIGGNLVSIHNGFQNSDVAQLAQSVLGNSGSVFLGGKRVNGNNNGFEWADGSPYNYWHWAQGQPTQNDCISLQLSDMNWYTTLCSTRLPVICSLPNITATVPPSTPACTSKVHADIFIVYEETMENRSLKRSDAISTFIANTLLGYPGNPYFFDPQFTRVQLIPYPDTEITSGLTSSFKDMMEAMQLIDTMAENEMPTLPNITAGLELFLSENPTIDDSHKKVVIVIGKNNSMVHDATVKSLQIEYTKVPLITISAFGTDLTALIQLKDYKIPDFSDTKNTKQVARDIGSWMLSIAPKCAG